MRALVLLWTCDCGKSLKFTVAAGHDPVERKAPLYCTNCNKVHVLRFTVSIASSPLLTLNATEVPGADRSRPIP